MHRYRAGGKWKPSSQDELGGNHLDDDEVDDYPFLTYDDERSQLTSIVQDTFQIGALILEMVTFVYAAPELETIENSDG